MIDILGSLDDKIENNTRIKQCLVKYGLLAFQRINEKDGRERHLDELFSFVNGYTFKSSDYTPHGNYKVITIKNIATDGFNASSADKINYIDDYAKSKLFVGDILLTMTGEVGRVGIVDIENALLNQRVLKVISPSKFLTYFALLSHGENIKALAKGSVQQNLGLKELSKYSIRCGNICEYLEYEWVIDKMLSLSKENERLNELKQLYLKKFFG